MASRLRLIGGVRYGWRGVTVDYTETDGFRFLHDGDGRSLPFPYDSYTQLTERPSRKLNSPQRRKASMACTFGERTNCPQKAQTGRPVRPQRVKGRRVHLVVRGAILNDARTTLEACFSI